jgi:hypothetical protein
MNLGSPGNLRIPRVLATLGPAVYPKNVWWNVCLATRVTGLLCLLPILENSHTLPALLGRLAPIRPKKQTADMFAMERAIRLVLRICHRRPFRSALFPKACLRQSLVLYHVLTYLGFPVEFHLGVRKQGEELIAHSWVTMQGEPLADTARSGVFKVVYSYPYNTLSSGGIEIERSRHKPISNESLTEGDKNEKADKSARSTES